LWEFTGSTSVADNPTAKYSAEIYPNPSDNFISVNSQKEIFFAEIFDITGRRVIREKYVEKINVENLKPGVYHVKLEFEDGKFANKQFIKTN
jgi:hypothetical protein